MTSEHGGTSGFEGRPGSEGLPDLEKSSAVEGASDADHASARDCDEVLENLYVFIDNELPEADRSEIQAHLDECRGCLSEADIERLIKALVQKSCHEKAPAELRQRVLFSIRHVQWQITTGRLD